MKNKKSILKYIILQVLITGAFIPLVKYIYNSGVEPLNFSCHILLSAFLIMTLYTLSFEKGSSFRITGRHALYLALIGITGGGVSYALFSIGLKMSTAVNCTFLLQSSVFLIPVLSYVILREHLKPYKIIMISVLLAGVFFVTTSGKISIPGTGDFLVLLSALSFSIGTILSKIILADISVVSFSLYRTLFGGLSLLIFLILTGAFRPDISLTWVPAAGLMIAAGTLAFSKALRETTASYVSMMSMSAPVIAAVIAYLILGEEMTAAQIAGGVVVVFSGVLVHYADV